MFEIVDTPISLDELAAHVGHPESGAIATFTGTTRETNNGRNVERLEYEAYEDLAVAEFERIADRVRERWDVRGVAIVHRVGVVPIGETSVAIAVSAPHRGEALEACQYAIDELKLVAPIWKKEYFEDGEVWIGSLADCRHDHDEDGEAGV